MSGSSLCLGGPGDEANVQTTNTVTIIFPFREYKHDKLDQSPEKTMVGIIHVYM